MQQDAAGGPRLYGGQRTAHGVLARNDHSGNAALHGLISRLALSCSDEPVLLASGRRSRHYFDLRRLTGDPRGIAETARAVHGLIERIGAVRSVGGIESGSIPISAAVSLYSGLAAAGDGLPSFYVRKRPKEHGLARWVEGMPASPSVLVEDVITSGQSALKALRVLADEQIEVRRLIAVVYRDTPEAKARLEADSGVKIDNLFYESDFAIDAAATSPPGAAGKSSSC